ncbi:MAG: hypothetical protein ABIX28_20225 [Vicinamibacterales bacterium]
MTRFGARRRPMRASTTFAFPHLTDGRPAACVGGLTSQRQTDAYQITTALGSNSLINQRVFAVEWRLMASSALMAQKIKVWFEAL